jgi:hypothetical protein
MPDERNGNGNGNTPVDLAVLFTPGTSPAGLQADDPRLQRVNHLALRGDYEPAAAAATGLVRSGVRDVRLVGAFLLGAFLKGGVQSLAALLDGAARLLGDAFPLYGPAERKPVLLDNSLGWFFRTLLNNLLKFHDDERDATWTKWILGSDEELVDEIVLASERVMTAAKATLGTPKLEEDLTKLQVWCDVTFRQVVERKSMLPSLPITAIEAAAPAPKASEPRPRPASASAPAPAGSVEAPAPVPDTLPLAVSPALRLLLRKLAAFETLVGRGDLLRAAIVSSDLQRALETFDPKLYIPSLLASYFATLSQRVDDVTPHLEKAGSPSWQALEQFYQVDLDAFVAANEEPPT